MVTYLKISQKKKISSKIRVHSEADTQTHSLLLIAMPTQLSGLFQKINDFILL